MIRYGLVTVLLLLTAPTSAQQAEPSATAPADSTPVPFSPEPGYACDREQQRCWKNEQPSFLMMRLQFGDDAALVVLQETPLIVDLAGEVFYPESGVSCDYSIQVCYDKLQVSRAHTGHYFNTVAAQQLDHFLALRDGTQPMFTPKRGTSCVRKSRICYDQHGPSLGLTRLFFGHADATRLIRGLLRHQAAQKKSSD